MVFAYKVRCKNLKIKELNSTWNLKFVSLLEKSGELEVWLRVSVLADRGLTQLLAHSPTWLALVTRERQAP